MRRLPAVALAAAFAALAAALVQAGDAVLAGPPLTSWADAERWYEAVGPTAAAMALLRWVGIGLALWLAAATALQVLASFSPSTALRRIADAVSPPRLRRLGHALAAASATAAITLPGAAMAATEPPPNVAIMRPLDGEPPGTAPVPEPAAPPTRSPRQPAPHTRTVRPGDSVWRIAQAEAAARLGRHPADGETAALWVEMVRLNEEVGRFPSGDPDLIWPGQELLIPPP